MGGSTSKVGRRLPTKARTSGHESQELGPAHSASRRQRPPQASQAKSEGTPRAYSILHTIDNVARTGVERDGKDPHLLANLSRLGQVDVHSTTTTSRAVSV